MLKTGALKYKVRSGAEQSFEEKIDVKVKLQSAVQHHRAGRLETADQLYCRVLEIIPDNSDALHLRGVIALQQGRHVDAADLIQRAIQMDPTRSIFYNNLGNVLKEKGQLNRAISAYRKALKLNPDYFEAYYDLGNVLQELRRFGEAVSCYRKALKINSEMTVAYNNLGIALNELGREEEAIRCYHKAVEKDPNLLDAHNNLAALLEGLNCLGESRKAVNAALRIDPQSYFAKLNLAQLEFRCENFEISFSLLEELTKSTPPGEFASRTYTLLGMVCDKLGKCPEAFEAFSKGNAHDSATYQARCLEKERKKDLDWINQLHKTFDSKNMTAWEYVSRDDEYPQPLFLVGFPRSGTTLLEQILDAHSAIASMEEKPILENSIRNVLPEKGQDDDLSRISTSIAVEFRRRYWKLAHTYLGDSFREKIVLDKLPLNIVNLGFIQRFFPNAKVIVALRHPLDTVLSNFMQRYKLNTRMANFLDIQSSAQFYIAVMSLYRHFQKVLSMDIIEIRYEDIVSEFEPQLRRLLHFLDLPWDQNVLKYNTLDKGKNINTPSYSQVIKPIYKDAVSRWQKYEKQLAPIIPRLKPLIRHFGYSV